MDSESKKLLFGEKTVYSEESHLVEAVDGAKALKEFLLTVIRLTAV